MRSPVRTCGVVGSLVAIATMALPVTVIAVESCKVRVDARDGTLLVSAKAVAANPRWGFTPDTATNPFANEAACVVGGSAKKCALGELGTAARITPPNLCTLYVTDASLAVCAAYIKGCVPGARDPLQGPPGPQGEPGPQGVEGPRGLTGPGVVVKDSEGTLIGVWIGEDNNIGGGTTLRSIGGVVVGLRIVTPTLIGGTALLFYPTSDCSGAPFVEDGPLPLIASTGVVGSTVFYESGQAVAMQVQSLSNGPEGGCTPTSGLRQVVATASEDLSGLVPPFHVEVQP